MWEGEFSTFVVTPNEFIKDEIYARWYEYHADVLMSDRVDGLTYDMVLLVAHTLDTRIRNGIGITNDELMDFILSEWWVIVMDQVTTLN